MFFVVFAILLCRFVLKVPLKPNQPTCYAGSEFAGIRNTVYMSPRLVLAVVVVGMAYS